jgi:uncharacterized RDD family membrane protein YckC
MSTVAGGVTFCAACGAALEPGAVFCGTCGARVPAPDAPATPEPARVPAAAATPTWSLGADVDDAVAPVWRRVVALLVDQLLAVAVGLAGLLPVLPAVREDGSLGALLVPGLLLLLLGAGQWLGEAFGGRTVGGALLGTRTLSVRTGRPAGLWAVLVRSVVQGLGAVVGGIGVYVVAGSGAWDEGPEQRGWHDKAAGTLVLRARPVDRSGAAAPAAASAATGAGAVVVAPAAEPTSGPPPGPTSGPPPGPTSGPPSGPTSGPPRPAGPEAAPGVPLAATAGPTSGPPQAAGPAASAARAPSAAAEPLPSAPVPAAPDPASTVPAPVLAAPAPVEPAPVDPAPAPERDAPDDLPDATVPGLGDLEHTRVGRWAAGPEASGPAAALVLVVDTGERVPVTGAGLIGRRPVPGDETWAHLVTIDDPTQSVSSTHLAFWPAEAGLDVLDRGSTNGTVLLDPAGKPWTLPPGAPARVAAGWTLVLGNRRVHVAAA